MIRIRLALLLLFAALATAACGVARTEFGPAPVSGQRCVGMPDPLCAKMLADERNEPGGGAGAIVGIEIVCTTICTEANGEATVTRTYANGQTTTGTQGWSTPIGPLPGEPGGPALVEPTELPVKPACIGVDLARCLEFAAEALGNSPAGAVAVSIEVRCTGACTTSRGDGTTTARFADGTSQSSGWSYRSQ
jgi:hypothetical protein